MQSSLEELRKGVIRFCWDQSLGLLGVAAESWESRARPVPCTEEGSRRCPEGKGQA